MTCDAVRAALQRAGTIRRYAASDSTIDIPRIQLTRMYMQASDDRTVLAAEVERLRAENRHLAHINASLPERETQHRVNRVRSTLDHIATETFRLSVEAEAGGVPIGAGTHVYVPRGAWDRLQEALGHLLYGFDAEPMVHCSGHECDAVGDVADSDE